MKLLNKNAFITGGSSGIGSAIAKLFAKEGANISFCHFNDDLKAKNVIDNLNQFSKKNYSLSIDIGSKKIVKYFMKIQFQKLVSQIF